MAVLQEYKCPNCGGSIEFSSESGQMKCPYCESEFSVDALKYVDDILENQTEDTKESEWEATSANEWEQGETDNMRVYSCTNCGGEIVADETTGATHCPFCSSPVVMMGQFSGALKPDFVIPFKLNKQAAKDALKKHISKKHLVPKIFKDKNHIDEIKGIYVPFWLFDADVQGDADFEATQTHMWSDSKFDYVETSHFRIKRSGNVAFSNVPVDGSSKMPDDLMESIEPFDFSDAVDFQTAYLSGYLADKYDVDDAQSRERAHERMRESTQDVLRSTVMGYSSVTPLSCNVKLSGAKAKYALYPVWLLNTSCNGESYKFAMNAQTGKLVGNVPTDKKKAALVGALLALGYTAVAMLIMLLLY